MERIPYTNPNTHPVHIGSVIVRPGETRMVDPRDVPGAAGKAAPSTAKPAAAGEDALTALLDGSIPEVTAALAGLDADQLDALEAAEQAGKTRKGVLAAIAEAREALAGDDGDDDQDGEAA